MQKGVYLNEDIDDWKILVKHLCLKKKIFTVT